MDHYDAIIIGSGQGGKPLATTLGKAGWKTALIERAYIGGTCINYGCTPTKTMFNSARVAYLARRAADFGVHGGDVRVDMKEVRERKQRVVEEFRESGLKGIKKTENLDLLTGDAWFTDTHTIEVKLNDGATRTLTAEKIFINTGGRPAKPNLEGIDEAPTLDSTSIMELDELPEHLLVLGGGYIGLEFGQMFRRFGSEITIVQSAARLMMIEDEDVSDEVAAILRDDGITVLTSSTPVRVEPADGGRLRLTVRTEDGERQLEGSHLLSAIGRIPNT